MRKKKVCIGIPCYAQVSPETLEDYMRFAYHLGRRYQECDFFLCIKSKSEQFRARNVIVEAALSIGCDWLLMMDDDHVIGTDYDPGNPETGAKAYDFLRKLIDHDVDVVGPVYYQRGGSAKPVVMDEDDHGIPYFISDLDLGSGLEERAIQGGGCILINMRIFDKIKSPWFEPEFQWGTDIQICKKARDAGFKVYNDSSLEIGHVMNERVVITSKNKDLYKMGSDTNTSTPGELNWQTDSILHKYKYDAAEYLEIPENNIEEYLTDTAYKYGIMSLLLEQRHGMGTKEYYANMEKEQLCRQVHFHFTDLSKTTMATLLQNIKSPRLVGMDFGCGSAPVGFELAKRGGEMYFVDIDGSCSYEFLKWRCNKYELKNVHFDWPEPNTLNYCLCLDSIEHLIEWEEILTKIISCLKPGGNLITNFMRLRDEANGEHIFMDKPAFIGFIVKSGMIVSTDCVFVKGR